MLSSVTSSLLDHETRSLALRLFACNETKFTFDNPMHGGDREDRGLYGDVESTGYVTTAVCCAREVYCSADRFFLYTAGRSTAFPPKVNIKSERTCIHRGALLVESCAHARPRVLVGLRRLSVG